MENTTKEALEITKQKGDKIEKMPPTGLTY
jgi:hypothetical protein